MMKKYAFTSLTFLFINMSFAHKKYVTHEKTTLMPGVTETIMVLHVDNQPIGCVYCTDVLHLLYVLHTLYISPEHRCQGYGTKLGLYACEVTKRMGAKKIYIQPGPFELEEKSKKNNKKLKKLVSAYQGQGFSIVPKFISKCAVLLYKIMGIDEDPAYLMSKN